MKKSSLFENLVMNFSIDTEELSKTEEKKLKSVPTRLEILAEGFASRWDLDQVNQMHLNDRWDMKNGKNFLPREGRFLRNRTEHRSVFSGVERLH